MTDTVVIESPQGRIRGRQDVGVSSFRGIPYAAPPIDEHRFGPPAPPPPWSGILDALAFGPTAPRVGYPPPFDRIFVDPLIPGAGCLTVNVWTPDPTATGLPVMVWIHGGAFRNGTSAAPLYDGSTFARDGVVLVSLNYRLGVDGFLLLDGEAPNRGLLDQVAALRWVRENIASFGGDPGNVTVFGESAGAISICALLAMPQAAGLFQRAIAQSGGAHHALPAEDARRVTSALAKRLGVDPSADGIRHVEPAALQRASAELATEITLNPDPGRWGRLALDLMPFEPTIDGDVLPSLPIDAVSGGAGSDIPIMTGTTAEEWRLFLVPPGLIDLIGDPHVSAALAAYGARPEAAELYASLGGNAGDRLCAVIGDWYLRVPAVRLAEARAHAGAPTFVYEMAWRSPAFDGRLGACHGLELPFVFDTLATESGRALAGEQPPHGLPALMRSAWVAFARDGDPGWDAYDVSRRAVMVFDEDSAVIPDVHGARREIWDGLR